MLNQKDKFLNSYDLGMVRVNMIPYRRRIAVATLNGLLQNS